MQIEDAFQFSRELEPLPVGLLGINFCLLVGYSLSHRTVKARKVENFDGDRNRTDGLTYSLFWCLMNLVILSKFAYDFFLGIYQENQAGESKQDLNLQEYMKDRNSFYHKVLNLILILTCAKISLALKFMLESGRSEQVAFECIPRKRKELSARIQRTNVLPMDEVQVDGRTKDETEQKIKGQVGNLRISLKQQILGAHGNEDDPFKPILQIVRGEGSKFKEELLTIQINFPNNYPTQKPRVFILDRVEKKDLEKYQMEITVTGKDEPVREITNLETLKSWQSSTTVKDICQELLDKINDKKKSQ